MRCVFYFGTEGVELNDARGPSLVMKQGGSKVIALRSQAKEKHTVRSKGSYIIEILSVDQSIVVYINDTRQRCCQ